MSSSPASAVSSVDFAELSRLGGIGCLLQPGLFCLRIQKSMRGKFNPLIKFCSTSTVPVAKTESIGFQADSASWRMVPYFLLAVWTISSWPKTHNPYPDLVPSGQFHSDQRVLVHLPGLAKNVSPRPFANALGRLWRQLIKPPGRYV